MFIQQNKHWKGIQRLVEHAIILLKPSPIKEILHEYLTHQFKIYNLTILENKIINLTVEQVDSSFTSLYKKQDYVKYMTSDSIDAFLIKGDDAIHKSQLIKRQIRFNHGVTRFDLHNLVHSSDEGLEYYLQFSCLFPERDVKLHCGFADAAVIKDNFCSNSFITFAVNKYEFQGKIEYYGFKKNFIYRNMPIEVVSYFNTLQSVRSNDLFSLVNETRNKGGVVALMSMPIFQYTDELIKELSDIGIQAAFVFDKSFTLEESKNLQDYLDKYDIIPLGGSFNCNTSFEMTISEHTFNRFKERMKRNEDKNDCY